MLKKEINHFIGIFVSKICFASFNFISVLRLESFVHYKIWIWFIRIHHSCWTAPKPLICCNDTKVNKLYFLIIFSMVLLANRWSAVGKSVWCVIYDRETGWESYTYSKFRIWCTLIHIELSVFHSILNNNNDIVS